MIYKIECETDSVTYSIADSSIMEVLPVLDPIFKEELNNVPTLTFALPSTHPNRDYLEPLVSIVRLYIDGDLAFQGRALTPEYDWNNTAHYTCEGALAYLNDSIMRPYGYSGTITYLLNKILTEHNDQVESRKQIQLGTVDVDDSIGIEEEDYSTCMDALGQLLSQTNGYISIRVEDDVTYMDFLEEYAEANTQTIRFGANLLDLKKYQTAEELKTAIIPLGATLDNGSIVDITSVNDGDDYIYDSDAVSAYGWIWATVTWDTIETPAALLTKAQDYLAEICALPETVEVSAVDLATIDADIERFKLGGATTMVSVPHGISKTAVLTEKEMHLSDPAKDTITIGATTKTKTLTGQNSNAIRKFTKKSSNNASSASRFAQFVSGGLGGYVVLDYSNDGDPDERELPYRILIMDSDNKEEAVCVLQLNKDGIGFSSNGVDGDYYNSWTIDGQLSLGGTDNAYGALQILDPDGVCICSVNKNGYTIYADDGSTVIGQWSHDGIVLNEGTINFQWGSSEVGVYADGDSFQVGDFVCNTTYGRGIFQSSDEMTGMSAEPDDSGDLYLWAGYTDADDYVFCVNSGDAYVMYGGQAYPIGESLANLNSAIDVYAEENTDDDVDDYEDEDSSVASGLVYEDGWVISPATS